MGDVKIDRVLGLETGADVESERTVNVHVRHLFEKLELAPIRPSLVLTVPGIGYRLVDWPSTHRAHRRDV